VTSDNKDAKDAVSPAPTIVGSLASLSWLDAVAWDAQGLVPVIAQEALSGEILMFAWMNREALMLTVAEGRAVYWSRSRQRLWRKGEESGHVQWVKEIRLDCDNDVVLLKVEQVSGLSCHTGRKSCFFQRLESVVCQLVDPLIKAPEDIYK
jgi:phosphoribosyl-AMP cyclohydrolase